MDRQRRVVVGVDGSAGSASALREAIRRARATGAEVEVVHALDALVLEDLESTFRERRDEVRKAVLQGGRDLAARLLAEAKVEDVTTHVTVEAGDPAEVLLARCREGGADLLVLGAADDADALGSVAFKCVRNPATDVLVVRASHRGPFRRVSACVDFSPSSLAALARAARTAREDGGVLEVLHAYAPPWEVLHYRAPTPEADPAYRQRYLQTLQQAVEGALSPLAQVLQGVKVERRLLESAKPAHAIVEHLARSKADLAVLGTRGRSRLAYAVLGSTADRVLRRAPCSILAVRSA